MEPSQRSTSLPVISRDDSSSKKQANSSLLRRELDNQKLIREHARSVSSLQPKAGAFGLGSSKSLGITAALPKLSGAPSRIPPPSAPPLRTAPPTPKSIPPPAAPAKQPAAPFLTSPMKPEFANRLDRIAQIGKDSRSKKRMVDLIRPTYTTTPKPGGVGNKKQKQRLTVLKQVLSAQQQLVIEMVNAGKSVFFTGSAGTGKSTLLRELVQLLPRQSTFVTASTGMAAINIGGITLHQFAGIGIGAETAPVLLQRVQNSRAKENWQKVKVLIIDEISMVDAELFDKLEYIAREMKHNQQPFGGIQLVCCGDFFQIPPVSHTKSTTYAFESSKWSTVIQCNIELTTVYRQSEATFVRLLNELRHGNVTPEGKLMLEGCKTATLKVPEGIEPTRLYPLNKDVDGMNQGLLAALPGTTRDYHAVDKGVEPFKSNLQNHSSAPTVLSLKEGAQNLSTEQGLANGARGVVIGFNDQMSYFPIVRFISGVEKTIEPQEWVIDIAGQQVASRSQIPLRLGWAISIHKSQGLTLSFAEISLAAVFEWGQAYVALSRVSSLAGLKLLDFDPRVVKANPKVIKYYESFDDAARKLFQAHPVIKPAAAGASVTMEKTVIDIIEDDDEPQIMHL